MKTTAKSVWATSAALAMMVLGTPAQAGTATSSFQVSANVQAVCLISASPLSFGAYTGAIATATTTISVTCSNTTPYTIGLDKGTGSGCTENLRCMTQESGSAKLEYTLNLDAAYTNIWTSTNVHNGTGTGGSQSVTIYGRIRGSQYIAPDPYYDTVTATINF